MRLHRIAKPLVWLPFPMALGYDGNLVMNSKNYEELRLRELYRSICSTDVQKFKTKFDKQSLREKFHTLRELQFGAFHREEGFELRYELEIDGKTPDWSLLDKNGKVSEIVDVITLHQRYDKEKEIYSVIKSTNVWAGWITIPPDHIFRKFADKSGQYSVLVESQNIPFSIAAFAAFDTAIDEADLKHILYSLHDGWFNAYPEVAGIILFRERIFENEYTYFLNPWSKHVSTMCTKYYEK